MEEGGREQHPSSEGMGRRKFIRVGCWWGERRRGTGRGRSGFGMGLFEGVLEEFG